MRIFNRAHVPWFLFVCVATAVASAFYIANFHPELVPFDRPLPRWFGEVPPTHQTVGGTPLGLVFGAIAFAIFIFALLLGLRKKVPLWRIGNVQRWLRAHIWLTLFTIPLIFLHSGFHFGGPMTTFLIVVYAIVMVSGLYGLALQHQMPRLMKDRLPAETVFEQIPFIREQLVAAALKMRESFLPAPPGTPDAGAPAASAAKSATAGSAAMVSTRAKLTTPAARAKSVVGSTATAAPIGTPAVVSADATEQKVTAASSVANAARPKPEVVPQATVPETVGTPTARVPAPPNESNANPSQPIPKGDEAAPPTAPEPTPPPVVTTPPASAVQSAAPPTAPAAPPPPAKPKPAAAPVKAAKPPPPTVNPKSEAILVEVLERQVLPYLEAKRARKHPFENQLFAEDTFRFVKLRVAEAYRSRVEEMQSWCDERRMLGVQARMHHWLHGWLFVHVPISFVLVFLTAWHAFVTLFRY